MQIEALSCTVPRVGEEAVLNGSVLRFDISY